MKRWGMFVALLAMGCQSAPPQPDWTPPRAQILSGGQKNQNFSEYDRENLAVGGAPRPRPSFTPLTLPAGPAPEQPHMPGDQVPSHFAQQHQPAPAAEVAVSTVPSDVPEVSSSEGNLVDATAETGVDSLSGGGTQIAYVMVDITPRATQIAGGCDLALAVDVSGSVLQGGLKEAVSATSDIYAQQGSSNRTWLIAFGSEAQLLVDGLSSVPGSGQLDNLLRTSRPAGGGTLLCPGIRLAVEYLSKSPLAGRARHVVVVSDGELGDADTSTRLAAEAWKRDGISFSGILVGDSSSGQAVLQDLASQCNGQFLHAQGMAGAGKLLREQANLARSIVLRDLRLEARLAPGVTLRRAFLAGPVKELATVGTATETLKLGDIHRQQNRRVLLELEVKPGSGRERSLAWISLLSKGPDAKEQSPQVLQQVRVLNGTKKPTVNTGVEKCVELVYAAVNRRR